MQELNTEERGATIDSTVGQLLRATREEMGLTLRDLAAITKIQVSHLRYLESDRYDEFPAEVFARGFLKNYARELRLDEDRVIEELADAVEPVTDEGSFAPAALPRIAYGVGLALLIFGLALSVLVFGDSSNDSAAAAYQPADHSDAWQPVPAGENDWQSYREN